MYIINVIADDETKIGLYEIYFLLKVLTYAINRRSDNAMIKINRTKGQTTIYKTLHRN
jgi:hypothetical protein